MDKQTVVWSAQPRQRAFMERPEDEVLYGGAAGGGKSDAMVIEATRQVHIPHYKGLILRKTYPQLTELIEKSQRYYPRAFPGARYNERQHTWRFPSGARILFGSMQHTKDKLNYQGKAYDFIGFDELTHFTYEEYIYLVSRNRPNGPGTRCYIRATANPGGIGHNWVKERFITAAAPEQTVWEQVTVEHPDGHRETRWKSRVFIPSSVFDNRILLQNDPEYLTRLASMPEAERRALLYGDWNSYSGQFFTQWRDDPKHYGDRRYTHVIEPFEIPEGWRIYRSFDWGYSKPFSCGWWAVDPDGVIYRILELYGCTGQPDEGIKWTPPQVFGQIRQLEQEHRWLKGRRIRGVADPAIWDAQSGRSIAEDAEAAQVYFSPADHTRIPGWMQMHYRMTFDENGKAGMYIFKNCKAFIRTVPTLQYSQTNPEDLDTRGEDHVADETRYFCMSRPVKPPVPKGVDPYGRSPLKLVLDIPREAVKRTARVPGLEIIEDD